MKTFQHVLFFSLCAVKPNPKLHSSCVLNFSDTLPAAPSYSPPILTSFQGPPLAAVLPFSQQICSTCHSSSWPIVFLILITALCILTLASLFCGFSVPFFSGTGMPEFEWGCDSWGQSGINSCLFMVAFGEDRSELEWILS